MWANRVITTLVAILHIPITIFALPLTFVSGIVSAIPLVNILYILVLDLVWQLFLWPLLLFAWIWLKTPAWISWIVAIPAIPLAILGDIFLKFTGSLSPDPEDRIAHFTKMSLCQQWPYVFAKTEEGNPVVQIIMADEGCGFVRGVMRFNDMLVRRQLGLL